MDTPPIQVDFNKIGYEGPDLRRMWVHLTTRGTVRDLARHRVDLREGMLLHVYDGDADEQGNRDDLVAQGVAHYDEKGGRWVAIVDTPDIKHVSEIVGKPDHWAAKVDWPLVHAGESDVG